MSTGRKIPSKVRSQIIKEPAPFLQDFWALKSLQTNVCPLTNTLRLWLLHSYLFKPNMTQNQGQGSRAITEHCQTVAYFVTAVSYLRHTPETEREKACMANDIILHLDNFIR